MVKLQSFIQKKFRKSASWMKLFINLVLSAILVVFSFRASEGQMDAAIRARVAGYTLVMAHSLQKKLASLAALGTQDVIVCEQGIKTTQEGEQTDPDRSLMHQFANDVRAAQTIQATNSEDSVLDEKKAFTFVKKIRVPRTGVICQENILAPPKILEKKGH
jgi:hypothetical protein